jgi:hypothetical protein
MRCFRTLVSITRLVIVISAFLRLKAQPHHPSHTLEEYFCHLNGGFLILHAPKQAIRFRPTIAETSRLWPSKNAMSFGHSNWPERH